MTFHFDRDGQRRIFVVVDQFFRRALSQRREAPQFIDQRIDGAFQFGIRHDLGSDTPGIGLVARDAFGAHHHVLGAGDADDFLQACGATRARDLPQVLLRQGVARGLRRNAEIAGQGQFETDAEGVTTVGNDHRFFATCRCRDVPGQLRNVFRRRFEEALDVATAGEVFTHRAQHDDAHVLVCIEGFEDQAQLIALPHGNDVQRRPVEDDVGALAGHIDFNLEAIELSVEKLLDRLLLHESVLWMIS
ncbi:hypothetical protein D3C84_228690 [compost metagenome]